jgi:gamma-glutamylcyclotransferase (GGCT)/AIG2-like uncharacterized protein YtfP
VSRRFTEPDIVAERRGRVSVHLFAYGTLILPASLREVTGESYASENAVLSGYSRFRLENKPYPGIVESPVGRTSGKLYLNIDRDALERLDRFEDDLYERRYLVVTTVSGERHGAFTYVVPSERSHLLTSEPWEVREFTDRHQSIFVASIGSRIDGTPRRRR